MAIGSGGSRSVRIRFDGDAAGLDRAARQGSASMARFRSDVQHSTDGVNKQLNGVATSVRNLFAVVGAATVARAGAGFFTGAIKQASDLQQAVGAVGSVFGAASAQVRGLADAAATSVGLSKKDYLSLAAVVGSQLRNMGRDQAGAAAETNNLIKLGSDLAATYGGTVADAVSALSGVLKGETDPIERYGVSIKQSDIQAQLAAHGLENLQGKALKEASATAALNMVVDQTAAAHGQWAAQTNSVAEQSQIVAARADNLRAQIGDKLLPIVLAITKKISALVDYFSTHTAVLYAVAAGVAAISAAVAGAAGAFVVLEIAASPIIGEVALMAAGLALLVAGFTYAWNSSETFQKVVVAAVNGTKDFVVGAVRLMTNLFLGQFDLIISGAAHAFGWIPGLGGLLKDANQKFDAFQLGINHALDAIQDRDIHINGDASGFMQAVRDATRAYNAAGFFGPALPTPTGPTSVATTVGLGGYHASDFKTPKSSSGGGGSSGPSPLEKAIQTAKDKLARAKADAKSLIDTAKQIRDQIEQSFLPDVSATTSMVEKMTTGGPGGFNVSPFGFATGEQEITKKGPSLLARLKEQANRAEQFVKVIAQLRKGKLDADLINQFIAQGPDALAAATEAGQNISGVNEQYRRIEKAGESLAATQAKAQTGVDLKDTTNVYVDVRLDEKELKALITKQVKHESKSTKSAAKAGSTKKLSDALASY